MIRFNKVSLRRGLRELFKDANFTIHPGDSIGVVGNNGSGKSSLFSLLRKEFGTDSGDLSIPQNWRIAHMSQEVSATNRPAIDFVMDGDEKLRELETSLATAEKNNDNTALASLHAELDAHDGYLAPVKAAQLLSGLGFAQADHTRPVADFSGGWRIRLNLARTLMCPSDLMLLDEPTNHLDLDTVGWLEQWLQRYEGTMLVISHDRDFLDATTQRTLQFERNTLVIYKGNYSAAEQQKAERLAQHQAMFEKQQQRISEIDAFVRRFRAKATKAKQAQSRLKELERLEKIEAAHVDSPFNFRLPCWPRLSDPLLNLSHANLGYSADTPIVSKVNISIRPGDRFGILGPNGAGKSTLLKTLAGILPPLNGERVCGEHLRIGYFTQHQLETLDEDASPFLHLQRLRPDAAEQEIRNFVGSFGFDNDQSLNTIENFSGGEQARLALAMIAWQQPNLLILDEPTNHLDLEMRHALTVALQTYEGAVVVVSHDRHLLKNTVDQFIVVNHGKALDFNGSVEDYQSQLSTSADSDKPSSREKLDDKKNKRKQSAEQRKKLQPLRNEARKLEKQMSSLETTLADMEQQLADSELYNSENSDKLKKLLLTQAQQQKTMNGAEEQWLMLEEKLQAAEEESSD
jgi:ATP-binding cassette subfamily F protein 3